MKWILQSCVCIALFFVVGCATPKQVAQMEGRGEQHVFNAPYDAVWRATIDAAQVGDLRVRSAHKDTGYISAGRGMRLHTHGENVGIWVKPVAPDQTSVEVVSRQAGPPKFWFKNWQDEVLNAIGANLTREASRPVVAQPAGAERHHYHHRRTTIHETHDAAPPVIVEER